VWDVAEEALTAHPTAIPWFLKADADRGHKLRKESSGPQIFCRKVIAVIAWTFSMRKCGTRPRPRRMVFGLFTFMKATV
jgi:hypothetical protein